MAQTGGNGVGQGGDNDRVTLWWHGTAGLSGAEWTALGTLLSDAERARATRFRFAADRQGYVLAHALCRGLLAGRTGNAPAGFAFATGPHGKPEVIVPAGAPRLRVNLSHTRGMAAAALTVEHDIGVDVEWTGRDVDAAKVAARKFAPAERAALATAPEAARTDMFLSLWTLKEAYVKAVGKGLSQPLTGFAFDLGAESIRFDDPAEDSRCWRFGRWRPGPEHVLALALCHPEPGRVTIDAGPAPLDHLLSLAGQIGRR